MNNINAHNPSTTSVDICDVEETGFPLVPDDYHLQHVGLTTQGNGYWIDCQLVVEGSETRDFVAAYVFDREGNMISSEVVDQGIRPKTANAETKKIVARLKRKIDAKEIGEIWVRPFSTSFYGHTFGLVVRPPEDGEIDTGDTRIDAMPGWTLMFHGPWSHCNYAS